MAFFERDSDLSQIIVYIDAREREWGGEVYQMNLRAESSKLTNPLLTSKFAPSANSPEFGPVMPLPFPQAATRFKAPPSAMISKSQLHNYFTSVELPKESIPKPNAHTSSIGLLICGLWIIWLGMRK
jgi:hypothetical protein